MINWIDFQLGNEFSCLTALRSCASDLQIVLDCPISTKSYQAYSSVCAVVRQSHGLNFNKSDFIEARNIRHKYILIWIEENQCRFWILLSTVFLRKLKCDQS